LRDPFLGDCFESVPNKLVLDAKIRM